MQWTKLTEVQPLTANVNLVDDFTVSDTSEVGGTRNIGEGRSILDTTSSSNSVETGLFHLMSVAAS